MMCLGFSESILIGYDDFSNRPPLPRNDAVLVSSFP